MSSSDQDRHQLGDSAPVGLAILAALEDASRQSMAERERAIEAAHILSDRLRAAEGHAKQLETEIERFRQRVCRREMASAHPGRDPEQISDSAIPSRCVSFKRVGAC